MPNFYFIVFELLIYGLFALCLRASWQAGAAKVLRLLFGAAFGVLLELATIWQLNGYEYGRFLIMVMNVPLCIGVAWSVIIYSVMEFSDASTLSYWLRPVLDGLLALSLDLVSDTIAIRLGMWDWGKGLTHEYFGVPFANFWAWFWVVASFSFGYRLLARRTDWVGTWLSALLALAVGLAGVLGTNALIVFGTPQAYRPAVVALTLLSALLLVVLKRPAFYGRPVSALVFWIPVTFVLYFGLAGVLSGVIFHAPILLLLNLAVFLLLLFLHRRRWASAKLR